MLLFFFVYLLWRFDGSSSALISLIRNRTQNLSRLQSHACAPALWLALIKLNQDSIIIQLLKIKIKNSNKAFKKHIRVNTNGGLNRYTHITYKRRKSNYSDFTLSLPWRSHIWIISTLKQVFFKYLWYLNADVSNWTMCSEWACSSLFACFEYK